MTSVNYEPLVGSLGHPHLGIILIQKSYLYKESIAKITYVCKLFTQTAYKRFFFFLLINLKFNSAQTFTFTY